MILGIFMTGNKEGCGMYAEENETLKEICPACKEVLSKEPIKKDEGGFKWALKCSRHGLIRYREVTYSEIEEFNG